MITTTSKKNSMLCIEDICVDQMERCQECAAHVEQQVHPLRRNLYHLWLNLRLFIGTDRWDRSVTLQRGDSHYTMKMEEIEAHWRNR